VTPIAGGTHSDGTVKKAGADLDVQRLGGSRIFVMSTRPLPFGEKRHRS
jgi:hypothetical protein